MNKINMDMERRTKYFVHVVAILSLISIFIFAILVNGDKNPEKAEASEVEASPQPFTDIALEAKAAIVVDLVNGRELFSKNPDEPLPLASLTKVITALTADLKLPNSLSVRIRDEYLAPEGDSGLISDDVWQARDLRDFTLLTSSNDGAFALAAAAESLGREAVYDIGSRDQFVKAMNDTALEIGLLSSKFYNEHGLDREADKGGAYGSARDMATLFEYIIKNRPAILEATRYDSLSFKSSLKNYLAENTNPYINEIPNVIASKTGYTDLAGGNLVVVFDAGVNMPIAISVLGSSQEGRFSDTLKLVEASLKAISN
jgi:D-alanyl-D-alanine carboxypeptidase (penicillin-binding protein 5/6)